MSTVTCLRCYAEGVRMYSNEKAFEVASYPTTHIHIHRTLHDQLDTALDTIRRADARAVDPNRDYFDFSIRSDSRD